MKPNHFTALAAAAAASLAAAFLSYSSYLPWTEPVAHAQLFPGLEQSVARVSAIEVSQAGSAVNLIRKDSSWGLKERDGYPVNLDKVRTLLLALQEAKLVEDKTSNPERYADLRLEDPKDKSANSHSLRLLDEAGKSIAELIVGKVRPNAFGGGKGGTYVRLPGDAQSWLVDAEIDTPATIEGWVKTRIFETAVDNIRRITIEIPSEQPLVIEYDSAEKRLKLKDVPAGKQVKFANSVQDIADSLGIIDMEDVRKSPDTPAGSNVSVVKLESEGGLTVTYTIRKTPEADWLSMTAAGDGEHKKFADLFAAGAKGWEFKLAKTKAGEFLKTRADLIEDINLPETPGTASQPSRPDTPPAPSAP